MSKVRRALLFSFLTRYGGMLIGLASTMIVARLLTPDQIGTFAIASAIVMVISEFRLLGAGMYLVRESEMTEEKVRAALGLTMLISWGMGIGIWLSAIPVSELYDLPPVATIFTILSVSFFLAPFISIPAAMLTREFRFRELFFIRLGTSLSNLISTVVLIHMGYTYYALAWGYTFSVVVEFLIILTFMPARIRWQPSFRNLKPIASFGIYNSLAGFFRRGVVTAPDMIIGKLGTTAQVGLFSRGLGFIEFMSQILLMGVKPVVLPFLSEVQRTGKDVNQAYIGATVLLGGFVWPVLAVASVVSLPVIRLFFGDQWDAAAPFATMLAYWAMFRTVHWFSSDLLVARGKERLMVLKEGVMFVLYCIGIVAAYPHGLVYVAGSFAVVGFLDFMFTTILLGTFLNLEIIAFFHAWIGNTLITGVCWSSAWGIYQIGKQWFDGTAIPFLAVACFLPLIWVSSIFLIRHPLKNEVVNGWMWFINKFRSGAF
jgi:O-antigen/teichoic acid export membrane protein